MSVETSSNLDPQRKESILSLSALSNQINELDTSINRIKFPTEIFCAVIRTIAITWFLAGALSPLIFLQGGVLVTVAFLGGYSFLLPAFLISMLVAAPLERREKIHAKLFARYEHFRDAKPLPLNLSDIKAKESDQSFYLKDGAQYMGSLPEGYTIKNYYTAQENFRTFIPSSPGDNFNTLSVYGVSKARYNNEAGFSYAFMTSAKDILAADTICIVVGKK